jgi:4'-phosphopantetheinyl transferase
MPIAILYYKVTPESIGSEQLSEQIADWIEELPIIKQKSLKRLRKPKDLLLSVAGLQLLKIAMEEYLDTHLSLADLQFPERGKPFFNANFDFNISHSGDMVCCIVSNSMKIGIDIELHREVSAAMLKKFTLQNDGELKTNVDKHDFFKLWTKNEAIIKAANQGSIHNMKEIKLEQNGGFYQGEFWTTYPIKIISVADNKEYTCHIACSETINSNEIDQIKPKQIYNLFQDN